MVFFCLPGLHISMYKDIAWADFPVNFILPVVEAYLSK